MEEEKFEKLFKEMEDDLAWLGLIKMSCETSGIGNSYFNKRDELKEKYKKILNELYER